MGWAWPKCWESFCAKRLVQYALDALLVTGKQDDVAGDLPAFHQFVGFDRFYQGKLIGYDRFYLALFQQPEELIPVFLKKIVA